MDVIKIGGSVLFGKKGDIKKKGAEKIFKVLSESRDKKIIVVGCGKKQHDFTYEWNLTDMPEKRNNRIILFERRHEKYIENYRLIEENLEKIRKTASKHMKITPINPADCFLKKSEGSATKHEIEWFNNPLIMESRNPVISGGMIPDKAIMFTSISSDTIAGYLAAKYKAKRLVFLTDVDGILDERGELVKKAKLSELEKINLDGGMADKIRRIKTTLKNGAKIIIANGLDEGKMRQALLLENYDNCTEIG